MSYKSEPCYTKELLENGYFPIVTYTLYISMVKKMGATACRLHVC